MATILAISSQVAYGRVGLSAYRFILERLGHEVICIPTVNYLTHAGLGRIVGTSVSGDTLADMGAELISLRLEEKIDYVISGYFKTLEQAQSFKWLITQLKSKNPSIKYCCDPIIGDAPKGIYIDIEVAEYIKDVLVPMADMVSPNNFEAQYLGALNNQQILLKSVFEDGHYKNIYSENGDLVSQTFRHLPRHLSGAGDLINALFIGYKLNGLSNLQAIEKSTLFLSRLAEYTVEHECDQLPTIENQEYL
ncbi:MAG: hypothetical protein HRU28_07485 [Rhizobiales bacterium]|nr:hypothetical protein [Hyphomicrobiales bacterium]